METKKLFMIFLKGYVIGIGALIPGVSGGTTAMNLGVFEDILYSVGNFFKDAKASIKTLLPIIIGASFSIVTFSPIISFLCDKFPIQTKIFFCIISFISMCFFAKQNINDFFNFKIVVSVVIGIIVSACISIIPIVLKTDFQSECCLFLLLIGFPLALALVLPGISFSYMLLFFGIYEKTLSAINTLNFSFLIPLFIGLLFGTFLFSKTLIKSIKKKKNETYAIVLGFIFFSLIEIALT